MEENEFLKLLKEHGNFNIVNSIIARENNKGWLCPSCKSPVVITKQERFETLEEHVCNPNMEVHPLRDAYQCSDKNCITKKNNIFWDYNGDRYGSVKKDGDWVMDDKKYFIDDNDSPFGSYRRRINVEIYKVGLKDNVFLSPAFALWFLQPYIQYDYVADNNGKILKTKRSISFLKKDKRSGTYSYKYIPFWRTWSFLYNNFIDNIRIYNENDDISSLNNAFEPAFNRAWVYKWFEKFTKIFYKKYYKISKFS